MKNIIGFIALITLLSGCGSSVENWMCEQPSGYKRFITIDFENNTWQIFGTKVRSFNEFGNQVITNGIFEELYDNSRELSERVYDDELSVTLDRDT
jgi:hypothetical protein